ncbi:hypothetical protein [Methanoculleus chikugoensis]|nr:hypothetical protein [Methanoculleus chikugoensis]
MTRSSGRPASASGTLTNWSIPIPPCPPAGASQRRYAPLPGDTRSSPR